MRFGKFVSIMTTDPLRSFGYKRDDGDLDHRKFWQMRAIQGEFIAMHKVLRIMQDDGGKAHRLGSFIFTKRIPQVIEVRSFRGRTIIGADDEPQAAIACDKVGNGKNRGRIVWIAANIKTGVLAVPRGKRPAKHRGQCDRFVPCRNENRDASLQRLLVANCRSCLPARQQPDQVEE